MEGRGHSERQSEKQKFSRLYCQGKERQQLGAVAHTCDLSRGQELQTASLSCICKTLSSKQQASNKQLES